MRYAFQAIRLNEQTGEVRLLHLALERLGYDVAAKEVDSNTAGESTFAAIRRFTENRKLRVREGIDRVDRPIGAAIIGALDEQGDLNRSDAFIVSGRLIGYNGRPVEGRKVWIYEISLKGAELLAKDVTNVGKLDSRSGLSLVGTDVSNPHGEYSVTVFDWCCEKRDRFATQLVAIAHDGKRVHGRSSIVRTRNFANEGTIRNLDILTAPATDASEFQQVGEALEPIVKSMGRGGSKKARTAEQIEIIAHEANLDPDLVAAWSRAGSYLDKAGDRDQEFLFALDRQGIRLDARNISRMSERRIVDTLNTAVESGTIAEADPKQVRKFADRVRSESIGRYLDSPISGSDRTYADYLSPALAERSQQEAFVRAIADFDGTSGEEFWRKFLPKQPEFKNNPDAISSLLLTQQLTVLTGNNQALIAALQKDDRISSARELARLGNDDWLRLVEKSGIPERVTGADDAERARNYARAIRAVYDSSFPTYRIEQEVRDGSLAIEDTAVKAAVSAALQTDDFDIATSSVDDFEKVIRQAAADRGDEAISELKRIQRLFQASPNTQALSALHRSDINSARGIAEIPEQSFVKTYADMLGGESVAYAVHQRASHIAARVELGALHMKEYVDGFWPGTIMGGAEFEDVETVLSNQLPNYSELFGSPDMCECEHCRSVYSAAAYFVELMRFLWRGTPNANGDTPLDVFSDRRPDLAHMPLTCENTNTLIPYVDLVNEVMEYYTVNDSLSGFTGFDTGDTSEEELRANPQNQNQQAYEILKDEVFPFTLPYHQPLDTIRSFSKKLETTRFDTIRIVNPDPDAVTQRALEAERLQMSLEQYRILTGVDYDGNPVATPTHEYYGYSSAGDLENLSEVREFMARSGVSYVDLVELIKTQLINPAQSTLAFLEALFSDSALDATAIYDRLSQIAAGTLQASDDADVVAAINAYNAASGTSMTAAELDIWVQAKFAGFQSVVTLYEPESKCDLDTTVLRTVESIYTDAANSGVTEQTWSQLHRFIRLWRQLGWTIHELDLMLAALGHSDITATAITHLSYVSRIIEETGTDINKLATVWGNIDAYGDKSLYRKLFLNRSAQSIDPAFQPNVWGDYLTGAEVLADHESTLLASFRIDAEQYGSILGAAKIIDAAAERNLDAATDALSLPHVSSLYRFVVLAKALGLKAVDMERLIGLFGTYPFSVWNGDTQSYDQIDPATTLEFCSMAKDLKAAGFKTETLQYIVDGVVPPDSRLPLDADKLMHSAMALRGVFNSISANHSDSLDEVTVDAVRSKLQLTFDPANVNELMAIVDGSASYEASADANLDVVIPAPLSDKYTYIKGSGRLLSTGVMSDDDRTQLKGLADINATFEDAVDSLYAAPEELIATNFSGVFDDLATAYATLLDHPAQPMAATTDERLVYIYEQFIPIVKTKLRQDAVTQQVASLVGTSVETAALLLKDLYEPLMDAIGSSGWTAEYFTDNAFTTFGVGRTDEAVNFDWAAAAPDPAVPADNFSARWTGLVSATVTAEHTLVVEVAEADEAYSLYLDGELVLDKAAGDAALSKEVVVELNAATLHDLRLDYVAGVQNEGISLYWKTDVSAREVLPASAMYPSAAVAYFTNTMLVLQRAGLTVDGFELSETEVSYLLANAADFGNVDLRALSADNWSRLNAYVALRNRVPQSQALLTDVFAEANSAASTLDDVKAVLIDATAWGEDALNHAVDTVFGLSKADFVDERALTNVADFMYLLQRSGISAQTMADLGQPTTDLSTLQNHAQDLKDAVRAKYTESDWLTLAGDINDGIRERQKQALIAHLLTKQSIRDWGATDADGLFEFFLIDVQMMPCMDTSRIVQANAAIQMFVQRILLNLESDRSSGDQTGVSPGAIDTERWEWMKNYRVWEANRKVFLYPENWLNPDWRMNRSPFFREFESYLIQNDISERTVEEGLRNYLRNLDAVANLSIVATYQENYSDGQLRNLHVFGRSQGAPFAYYYRRWNEFQKWSAWEKLDVEILGADDDGGSGVHLAPVLWKDRLFLFWLEIADKPVEKTDQSKTIENTAKQDSTSDLKARIDWEIHVAWSENLDGRWTPKQRSANSIVISPFMQKRYELTLHADVSTLNNELTLTAFSHQYFSDWVYFKFSDIQAPMRIEQPYVIYVPFGPGSESYWSDYSSHYQLRSRDSQLDLAGDVYLETVVDHKLANPDNVLRNENRLVSPFFYSDQWRTYFVRPVPIEVSEWVRRPWEFMPVDPWVTEIPWFEPEVPWRDPLDPEGPVFGGGHIPDPGPRPVPDYRVMIGGGSFGGRPSEMLPGGASAPIIVQSEGGLETSGLGQSMKMGYLGQSMGDWSTDQPAVLMMRRSKPVNNLSARMRYDDDGVATKTAYELDNSIIYKPFLDYGFGGFYHDVTTRADTGLEFHTFYHPMTQDFTSHLNTGGIAGLLSSDTELSSDEGATFEVNYRPVFTNGFVQKPATFADRTFYKENVCFDVYGANSIYNEELFLHAPVYCAAKCSENGQYETAMKWFHHVFNPTTDDLPLAGESETSRYWKYLPFKRTPAESLEDWFRSLAPNSNPASENSIIAEWRDNPFDPHLVASNRPLAYMKYVVIKYVENLIAWGDHLYRQFTRESVYEAEQLYVFARHVLGPRPQFVPKRGDVKAESYYSLQDKWDDFSNALVELENIFPYTSDVVPADSSSGPSLLGLGSSLYFCIPHNEQLIGYWDTVEERLFNIRHCRDINGVERTLALFAPPIDPAALIKARSQGLSIGSILASLSSPPPIYRFRYLIEKAKEFCGDVIDLGQAVIGALEKQDAEALARLRASHETEMQNLIQAVRERQVVEARAGLQSAEKAREQAVFRMRHYLGLVGNEETEIPSRPGLGLAPLTADFTLPSDTTISEVTNEATFDLVEGGETGIKVIEKEAEELSKIETARWVQLGASIGHAIAGGLHLIPNADAEGTPVGVGAGVWWGGPNIGTAVEALARGAGSVAEFIRSEATQAGLNATHLRRAQEWTYQANLAAREIVRLDKEITVAEIRVHAAQAELDAQFKRIEHAEDIELFLQDKFTNEELYLWLKDQLGSVYKQAYNLAYEMAKKAEKAYQYELGQPTTTFIEYGYWDDTQHGLTSGEKLRLALRQMEKSWTDENYREFEISKPISLALLDPLALIELRQTGRCYLKIPEELFDMDFPGQYFRRIQGVSISIPCVVGPNTSVNCTLRLQSNSYRTNTLMNSEGKYEHENDEGIPLTDARFRSEIVPVTAIATSQPQEGRGVFEFFFEDDRYVPFEGAGAISDWMIELSTEEELRQFDYDSIADVIIRLDYSAREGGGTFKDNATDYIKDFIANAGDYLQQPLMRMVSLRQQFPTEWHRWFNPDTPGSDQILTVTLGRESFPFFTQGRTVVISQIDVFAKGIQPGDYHLILGYVNEDTSVTESTQISVPQNATYGDIHKATIMVTDAGLNLEDLSIERSISLKLKHNSQSDFQSLGADPEEIEELYLVFHYKLD